MWTRARLTIYITAALGLAASLSAALGYGTYDAATRTFDLHPVQIETLAVAIVAVVAPALAAVATWLGWGRK